MENKEINEIETALTLDNDTPITLASYLTKLAGWNSFYTESLKDIQLIKPQKWLEIQNWENISESGLGQTKREKPLSDKKTEMMWATTPEGQKELELTFTLKRIDILYRSINKRLSAIENDFRMSKSQI